MSQRAGIAAQVIHLPSASAVADRVLTCRGSDGSSEWKAIDGVLLSSGIELFPYVDQSSFIIERKIKASFVPFDYTPTPSNLGLPDLSAQSIYFHVTSIEFTVIGGGGGGGGNATYGGTLYGGGGGGGGSMVRQRFGVYNQNAKFRVTALGGSGLNGADGVGPDSPGTDGTDGMTVEVRWTPAVGVPYRLHHLYGYGGGGGQAVTGAAFGVGGHGAGSGGSATGYTAVGPAGTMGGVSGAPGATGEGGNGTDGNMTYMWGGGAGGGAGGVGPSVGGYGGNTSSLSSLNWSGDGGGGAAGHYWESSSSDFNFGFGGQGGSKATEPKTPGGGVIIRATVFCSSSATVGTNFAMPVFNSD